MSAAGGDGGDSLGASSSTAGARMSVVQGTSEPGGSDGWLTPTAAAIAGFTLSVISLITIGTWVLAVQSFIARNGPSSFEDVLMVTGVAQSVVAVVAIVLARRGLGSAAPAARNFGGAGVLLGALGLVGAVLTFAAGIVAAICPAPPRGRRRGGPRPLRHPRDEEIGEPDP